MRNDPTHGWSKQTRDFWFYIFLASSTGAVIYLFSPYAYALLFAAVTVVVSWPMYQRILVRCGGRTWLASLLTSLFLALVVIGPLSLLGYMFAAELMGATRALVTWVQEGNLESLFWTEVPTLPDWLSERLIGFVERLSSDEGMELFEQGRATALGALNALTTNVPSYVNAVANASIEVMIFIFAVITMFMEGPRIIRTIKNLLPMHESYEDRLLTVFAEFSRNTVVGSLATAAVQGLVAGLGYWIAGMDRVLFFAILTAVGSFVPLVGTAFVWVPLAIAHGVSDGWSWGIFVALWSIAFTGTVDNLLKPLFLRGGSDMHPLLIFLAVFGGMRWMGLPGILVGPVIVAFFLALYTIYLEDYLGQPMDEELAAKVNAKIAPLPTPPPSSPSSSLLSSLSEGSEEVVEDVV